MADTPRPDLIAQVVDEIAHHGPSGFMRFLRHWPGGALSFLHLQVLMTLDADGPQPMRALAELLDVSQAAATGIVDRMESRGLVERTRDAEDRRVIRVSIATAGRDLLTSMATERRERLGTLLDELTDDELEGFLRGSRALRRARERLLAHLPPHTGHPPRGRA